MTRELFFEKWGPGPDRLWLPFKSDLAALIDAEQAELLQALAWIAKAELAAAHELRERARAAIAKAEGREP